MTSMIRVIARPGLRVPREDKARQYITDTETTEVPESAYYLRRLKEGDLVIANAAKRVKKEGE